MHARLKRTNAGGRRKMEILGLQSAEKTADRRIVKAVALTAQMPGEPWTCGINQSKSF